jgi:UDP-N-acetylglucosamine acyltransferase
VRAHPTAIVDPRAEIDSDVEIGPFAVVGPGVKIAAGTRVHGHVVLAGRTSIGRSNTIHPFAVIGGDAQLKKSATDDVRAGSLVIGDENVFREHVTVNTSSGERATTIGSKNLFMAGCHVAHDVVVGSCCVVANAVQIAGHTVVEDWVTFGGLSGVAQRLRVGQSAFVAAGAMCERDVPPFVIVQGDRARVRALNVVGLERRGGPAESVANLRRAFARAFVRRSGGFASAVRDLDRTDPYVDALARALLAQE